MRIKAADLQWLLREKADGKNQRENEKDSLNDGHRGHRLSPAAALLDNKSAPFVDFVALVPHDRLALVAKVLERE
jgi:hypothetical protein